MFLQYEISHRYFLHIAAIFLLKQKKQLYIDFLQVVLTDMDVMKDMQLSEFKSMIKIMAAWIGSYRAFSHMTDLVLNIASVSCDCHDIEPFFTDRLIQKREIVMDIEARTIFKQQRQPRDMMRRRHRNIPSTEYFPAIPEDQNETEEQALFTECKPVTPPDGSHDSDVEIVEVPQDEIVPLFLLCKRDFAKSVAQFKQIYMT